MCSSIAVSTDTSSTFFCYETVPCQGSSGFEVFGLFGSPATAQHAQQASQADKKVGLTEAKVVVSDIEREVRMKMERHRQRRKHIAVRREG